MGVEDIWERKRYYELARQGSNETRHFGMRQILKLSKDSKNILDLGCGEGTRLAYFAKGKSGVGIDISKTAIKLAQKRYPNLKFKVADIEKRIPFPNNKFDMVYSAYVFEHLTKPEKVVKEALRTLKTGGYLVIIAPNYGAPNRSSPVFKGSRFKKLINGIKRDLSFGKLTNLQWNKVQPMIENLKSYEIDLDTTIEPYIGTLKRYLKQNGCTIETWSSCWQEELPNAKIHQKIFRILSSIGIYPFTQWGPHLVIVARKIV